MSLKIKWALAKVMIDRRWQTMILLKASPPYSGKLQLHIKINWYLMFNVPAHKHKKVASKKEAPFTPSHLDQKLSLIRSITKKICFIMLKWMWHFGPFLLNNDKICHILLQDLIERDFYYSWMEMLQKILSLGHDSSQHIIGGTTPTLTWHHAYIPRSYTPNT